MMNPDPVYERLREIGWRRVLTEAEQAELRAWLDAHPEARADVATDVGLSRALEKLPDAPMPSNFTARVLQVLEREAVLTERAATRISVPWWRGLIPRFTVAAVVIGAGVLIYEHHETLQQAELATAARSLVTVVGATPLYDPTVMEDFDVIQRMSQADDGLLALSDDLLALKK